MATGLLVEASKDVHFNYLKEDHQDIDLVLLKVNVCFSLLLNPLNPKQIRVEWIIQPLLWVQRFLGYQELFNSTVRRRFSMNPSGPAHTPTVA